MSLDQPEQRTGAASLLLDQREGFDLRRAGQGRLRLGQEASGDDQQHDHDEENDVLGGEMVMAATRDGGCKRGAGTRRVAHAGLSPSPR